MIGRREFITLLGGAAAWPLAARAQESGKSARIAVFAGARNPVLAGAYRAFLEELHKLGFNEGQNLIVDLRRPDQDLPALTAQAAEMARAHPDVLVALGSETVLRACIAASRSIPIVFVANNYDPIARGYVNSLAKPGGNITGIFLRQTELAEKQVELLTQAFPERSRLAVLWDSVSADQRAAAEHRAQAPEPAGSSYELKNPPYDFDAAYQAFAGAGANMLLVLSSPFFAGHGELLGQLSIHHRLPAMFIFKGYTRGRRAHVLRGGCSGDVSGRRRPSWARFSRAPSRADLPVEQPTKYEWSSISRARRRWASNCRPRSSSAPTR